MPAPIACGVPAGTKIASPARDRQLVHRVEHRARRPARASTRAPRRAPRRGVQPTPHGGVRLGLDDQPRLGLAVRAAERLAGERAAGVEVDRQALAGVEQLDEQARGRGRSARVAEPRSPGIGGDRVAHQRPVLEAAEAALGRRTSCSRRPATPRACGRTPARARAGRDPRAAGVEVVQHVGRQDWGFTAAPRVTPAPPTFAGSVPSSTTGPGRCALASVSRVMSDLVVGREPAAGTRPRRPAAGRPW